MKVSLSKQFDNIKSWSELYDERATEIKKMILSHIMKAVRVNWDYEIDLTVDCEQLGLLSDEAIAADISEAQSV
jgi:hypothetical protein